MVRDIIYGVLGFVIFCIVGVFVGSLIYPSDTHETAVAAFKVVGIVGVVGAFLAVLFARWMATRGEQKLENLQSRPQIVWGISGAIFGGLLIMNILEVLNPTHADPYGIFLVIIPIGIFFCGWITLKIARRFNFPYSGVLSITAPFSEKRSISYWTVFVISFCATVWAFFLWWK